MSECVSVSVCVRVRAYVRARTLAGSLTLRTLCSHDSLSCYSSITQPDFLSHISSLRTVFDIASPTW